MSDRESDIYDYFCACKQQGAQFIVRAKWNRKTIGEDAAFDAIRMLEQTDPIANGSYEIEVPESAKTPKRTATVFVNWTSVELKAAQCAKTADSMKVWIVRVWEPNPPAKVKPIEWLLWSSVPVETLQDALERIDWYRCRWLIEDFHMCLKTGCEIERSQLDHFDDIARLLGFKLPIAARLLQLRQLARTETDISAEVAVDPLALRILRIRLKLAVASMTIKEFWLNVARLGGYRARKSDPPPGWRTIWYGWQKLSHFVQGAQLLLAPDLYG